MYIAEQQYNEVIWNLPDDFDSYENFERAVSKVEMQSSPGLPYCREHPTNEKWLEFDGLQPSPLKLQRLWIDVQNFMKGDFDVQYRTFIKMEPHKKSKCLEKRWRLIMACPLNVQIAWSMLFGYQNDLEIQQSYKIPSQQGLQLIHGDWKHYYRSWVSQKLVSSLDKSAWDWTAPYWALQMDLELRYRLARGVRVGDWRIIAERLYDDMFKHPTLVTTEGHILKQLKPGIMKSGCINTISTNSHCQVFMHILTCLETRTNPYPMPACLGDDTLHHPKHLNDDVMDAYKEYGIQIKAISEKMEFAGCEFTDKGPVPAYRSKHIYKLLHQPDDLVEDYLNSMCRYYAHDFEMYQFWEMMALRLGCKIQLSHQATIYWYDFAE